MKGIWFVTARRYVLQEYGAPIFERYVAALPDAIRDDVADPVVSRWYPEEHLREALIAFHHEVSAGSDAAFSAAMERCAVLGVHWFVQILVSVTSPAYLLRLIPATLKQTRRGPVRVELTIEGRSAIMRFTGQPYADDPRYALTTPAILRGVLGICAGPTVRTRLLSCDASTQVCQATW